MRLLDKYLLREMLIPLGYCFAGFTLLWITSDLVANLEEFQEQRLSVLQIARYYLILAPEFFVGVMPIALLLALLYALTNHSRHHELTAMRVAGLSLWRLSAPYFAVGIVFALASFAANELWVPQAVERAEAMRVRTPKRTGPAPPRDQIRNLAFNNVGANRTWQIDIYDLRTAEMTGPQIHWSLPDGVVRDLFARRASYTNGMWVFYGVDENRYAGTGDPIRTNHPSFSAPEFSETPEQIKSYVLIEDYFRSSLTRGTRKAELPLRDILNFLRLNPTLTRERAAEIYTQFHARIATPFTCLVVVLLALAFGVSSGRRNVFVGVASSIFIVFAYFVLFRLCIAFGSRGYLPPWLAGWLPNLAFTLGAITLIRRIR